MKTAEEITPPYTYRATITNVVDGDTVDIRLDLGMDLQIDLRVRMARINCPELHSKTRDNKLIENPAGVAAKAFTQSLVEKYGPSVLVATKKDKKEKFGRLLAELWIVAPNAGNMSDLIFAAGHAARFM